MDHSPKRPVWFILTRHWLSVAGLALALTAGISSLFVLPNEVRGHASNPYIGILLFLILPVMFFAGLALIPLGMYLRKREIRKGLTEPAFDRRAALRRLAWFAGVTTLFNVLIGSQITFKAVKHMETPQ